MQIDKSAINLMTDDDLAKYIPAFGDRLAICHYCTTQAASTSKAKTENKKKALFEKLRHKMKLGNPRQDTESEKDCDADHDDEDMLSMKKRMKGNKNAAKPTRKIELGWIHDGKQVRKRCGGGTRSVTVAKTSNKQDLLKIAKGLYFPRGSTKMVSIDDVTCDILDFQETPLSDTETIGEMYDKLKMGMIRFYLFTRTIAKPVESSDTCSSNKSSPVHLPDPFDTEDIAPTDGISAGIISLDSPPRLADTYTCTSLNNTSSSSDVIQFGSIGPNAGNLGNLDDTVPLEDLPCTSMTALATPDVDCYVDVYSTGPLPGTSTADPVDISSDTPSPRSPTPPLDTDDNKYNVLRVHRATHFKNPHIIEAYIKFKFVGEMGVDEHGVSREVYCAFWTEFCSGNTEGVDGRVPALNTKWQEAEWHAVRRIMLKGFIDHSFFPIKLSEAFTVALILGEDQVGQELLLTSILEYVSPSERNIINTAIQGNLDDEDRD